MVGHSFVSRYDLYWRVKYKQDPYVELSIPHEISVDDYIEAVYTLGKGGARIADPHIPLYFLKQIQPDLILLEYGSNDIVSGISPDYIARWVFNLAFVLAQKLSCKVGILSILPRAARLGNMSEDQFHDAMTYINGYIKWLCRNDDNIYFHNHSGFYETRDDNNKRIRLPVSSWSADLIHPNPTVGFTKYSNSIRNAIKEFLKRQ